MLVAIVIVNNSKKNSIMYALYNKIIHVLLKNYYNLQMANMKVHKVFDSQSVYIIQKEKK